MRAGEVGDSDTFFAFEETRYILVIKLMANGHQLPTTIAYTLKKLWVLRPMHSLGYPHNLIFPSFLHTFLLSFCADSLLILLALIVMIMIMNRN